LRDDKEGALQTFLELTEEDPTYGEAFNQASTVYFSLGQMDKSEIFAKRTICLIENHFFAMSGLGLVYRDTNRIAEADELYRKVLNLSPWSLVASKLNSESRK